MIAAAVAATVVGAGRAAEPPAGAQGPATGSVRVATSGASSERVRWIPIAKGHRGKERVVMSLGPNKLRGLRSGDLLEAKAEVEVSTTCIRPRWWRCVGRLYRFNPVVAARLVLAGDPRATEDSRVMPISGWTWQRCTQHPKRRNHHCVLTIPDAQQEIAASQLPCERRRCHLNLVVSAHHPRARPGHRLVIGVDARHSIVQDKGQLAAVVYRPQAVERQGEVLTTTERQRRRIPVGPRRTGQARRRVIYSQRLDPLRAGEQLMVDARAVGRIGHLSYNALVQSQLILSRRPDAARRAGTPKAVGTMRGRFGVQNGFNCTQARSGHSNPCVIRKTGVMRIVRDARERPWREDEGRLVPLYVSLVVGTRAVGPRGNRRRKGHRMRIKDAGFLRVHRYGPEFRRSAQPSDPIPDDPDGPDGPLPPLP
jgi:hypothetical protein